MTPGSILIYVHAPFYRVGETIYFDGQAQNGLRLWASNFDHVRIMAPVVSRPEGAPSDARPLQPLLDSHPTIEPVMMPQRGTVAFLLSDLWAGRRIIREKIADSRYLVFGFSGYIGDWGTVAGRIASGMNRPYAVFKDGVAHRVAAVYQQKMKRTPLHLLRYWLENKLMEVRDRRTVRGAALSLLHGQDTVEYYSQFSKNPHLVHNIHISKDDHITAEALDLRLAAREPDVLKISYAGRVESIKAPDQWVKALAMVRARGVKFRATWYGTGSLLEDQREQVRALGLADDVEFAGFVDQREMLAKTRASDVFVFTHVTDESPRCLIEALSMGLPLVGYDSAYPRDLVGSSGAGLFVPRGDTAALAEALVALAQDTGRLAQMSHGARKAAAPFNDADIFRERARIIKENL